MIGPLLVILVVALAAGGLGLWLGIVILAPRLQRRIDRGDAASPDERVMEQPPPEQGPAQAAKEPDARAD